MAIELNDFVKEILSGPCFGFVATINQSNQPVITRLFGFKHDEPLTTLTVYTFKKDAQRVVNLLSDRVKLTVTLSNATNFQTVQFKGSYKSHYDAHEEEKHYARDCNAKQAEIMEKFGVPREVFASWKYEPTVAIAMNVDEIYDQTPKIDAGKKII